MAEEAEAGSPTHLVVMGVSGSGKTTIAKAISERLGWEFGEGDDHHPQANRDKMSGGVALTDVDRWPWLGILAGWTRERHDHGRSTVLTCSALRRAYRDILSAGGSGTIFVHLTGDRDLLLQRMKDRDHFMPDSLLDSQFDTLEDLEPDETGLVVDVADSPERIAEQVQTYLSAHT
ncbi:MAG: gluconokinase [Ornithinimicrobium sp.]